MTALSTRRSFSGTALKTIACITMLVDHIGASCIEAGLLLPELERGEVSGGAWDQLSLFQLDRVLRFTGRLAFPIFCFLLVEGFVHTRDVKKYVRRLFLFAWELTAPLAFVLVWFYNGQRGACSPLQKKAFYWFYPVHLSVLAAVTNLIL